MPERDSVQKGVMKLHTVDEDGTITELPTNNEIKEAFFEENDGRFFHSSDATSSPPGLWIPCRYPLR
jgi:hypothetical protein